VAAQIFLVPLILSYTSNYQLSRSKAKSTPSLRRIIRLGTCGPVCTRMTIRWQSPPNFGLHETTAIGAKFQTGAAFLPRLAKPKTSFEARKKFFGLNGCQRRANACFIEANHLETNADIATTAFSNSWTTTRIQNITANV
jgi:hypothetical protein